MTHLFSFEIGSFFLQAKCGRSMTSFKKCLSFQKLKKNNKGTYNLIDWNVLQILTEMIFFIVLQ